jgi:DNA-binding transcriptional LysR family regulator
MDRFNAMRTFVEVANTGSFSQAADQLDLSRVKVTRHVKELEDWLNVRLLHRTTRSVSLTAPGHDLLQYCERILDQVAGVEHLARSHTEELVGEIRIAAPIGLGQNLLFEAIDEFTAMNPKVVMQLQLSDENALLVEERIDVALRYTHQPDDSLIARRLMAIDSAVCCAPKYLKEYGEINQLEQLAEHNCLLHLDRDQWSFIVGEQTQAIKVSGNIRANDVGVLVKAALAGKGLVYLPCDLANSFLRTGQLVQVLADYSLPSMSLWAVYLSRSYQRPVVRSFIDFLAQQWMQDIHLKSANA